ncbi:T9SS type A sorting domain-containing protein [Winogradskyella forsetii]|uniref:T9SS type A sorting domain-containing protein n=1 Tax=Winogradskyella forsetii TaxID=2686077 RepID=UPI0015BBBC0C|nr:T9SS type A sorting domain-containing protein [Winogradskyella forsetii]
MKKITLFIMMLVSISMYAQVEIVENFDNAPEFGLPEGWTTSTNEFSSPAYNAVAYSQCGGTGKSVLTGANTDFGPTPWAFEYILTTPNYPSITNSTDLTVSFSINVFEEGFAFVFPPTPPAAPVSDWGTVTLEYTVDGGNTWMTAVTVNPSDLTFTDVNTCTTIPAANLGALAAGNDFQARFVSNLNNIDPNKFALTIALDNISITQVATEVPNCDTTLLSPLDGSVGTDLNDTITWQAATGIPTGYNVSIGTTSGGTEILDNVTTTETSYSLAGLGLAYATEYFVNIVPYNGFGDATTGCIEESFTTRNAPIEGATCSNPYVITSFPYVGGSDNTANYENNVNEGPCGGFPAANIDGYDVFYEITPTTDISINIDLAQITEYGAAIHVTEGCPDTAAACVALASDDYSTEPPNINRSLQNVVLLAGTTYFITISSAGFDSTFSYGALVITKNSCINPEFTLTPVEDCGNGQFSVDVDVTYLGDATSLAITDGTNTIPNITSTGVYNIGSYPSTTTVDIVLTNDQDNSCDFTDSTFFYCPPSNDDCSAAIDLTSTINTDDTCTLFTSATNAGATESASNPVTCDFTGDNDVWFTFVASSDTMILEYLNVAAAIGDFAGNQSTELLDGSCGTFTSLGCFTNANYVTLNNLTINSTYYLRNSSSNTDVAQNFDICLREAPAAPANDECSGAIALAVSTDEACDNLLTGTTVGATPSIENTCNNGFTEFWKDVWYEFTATEEGLYRFTFNSTNFNASYFIYSGACGALIEESTNCFDTNAQVHSIASGESRYVMVRSSNTEPGFEFDLCVFKLPPPVENNDCSTPTVMLESTDDTGNNMISGNFANSYPSSEACDIGGNTIWYSFTPTYTGEYNFNLIPGVGNPYYSVFNTDDCSQTANNYVPNSGCYGSGQLTTDLVAGTTYLLSIYSFDTSNNAGTFDFLVYPDASLSIDSNNLETFKYYPNPIVNTLTVEAKTSISKISVYNMVGQQIKVVTPNNLMTVIDMNDLNKGVYFINVIINESQQTFKVIKE